MNIRSAAVAVTLFLIPVAMLSVAPRSATALPKYATKEKKACNYCHVGKSGGGKRTPAGEWYKSHDHTFKGWKDGSSPKPAPKKK